MCCVRKCRQQSATAHTHTVSCIESHLLWRDTERTLVDDVTGGINTEVRDDNTEGLDETEVKMRLPGGINTEGRDDNIEGLDEKE